MPLDHPPLLLAAAKAPSAVHRSALPSFRGFRPVPFLTSGIGHLMVRGEINGRPVDILIDSGASRTVIARKWAEDAELRLQALKEQAYGAGGASIALSQAVDARLVIGGVPIADVPLFAIPLDSVATGLKRNGLAVPQVILGADVLSKYRALIDYGGQRLWLAPEPR